MELLRILADTVSPSNPDYGPLPHVQANNATLQTVLTIVFTTTGAISLLIMTMSGFRYITARGSAQDIGKAKNAIVYSLVGLVISVSAGAIIKFVIGNLT